MWLFPFFISEIRICALHPYCCPDCYWFRVIDVTTAPVIAVIYMRHSAMAIFKRLLKAVIQSIDFENMHSSFLKRCKFNWLIHVQFFTYWQTHTMDSVNSISIHHNFEQLKDTASHFFVSESIILRHLWKMMYVNKPTTYLLPFFVIYYSEFWSYFRPLISWNPMRICLCTDSYWKLYHLSLFS